MVSDQPTNYKISLSTASRSGTTGSPEQGQKIRQHVRIDSFAVSKRDNQFGDAFPPDVVAQYVKVVTEQSRALYQLAHRVLRYNEARTHISIRKEALIPFIALCVRNRRANDVLQGGL